MSSKMKMCVFFVFLSSVSILSADEVEDRDEATSVEQRKTMAEHHEKMAICLRSEKTMEECRKEMMGFGRGMMGGQDCMMMPGQKEAVKKKKPNAPPR